MLASVHPAVQAAFELEGDEFSAAFELEGEDSGAALAAALEELPKEDSGAVSEQMREAGLLLDSAGPDMDQMLENFKPLLQIVAAAESVRGEIEPMLEDLERKGWLLRDPAQRIWPGPRDAAALTEDVDGNSAQLVRRLLQLLEE